MRAGCECNFVIATCPQRDLESTFLRCDNVAFTTLPQPKHNVATTLSQRDFVCWVDSFIQKFRHVYPDGIYVTSIQMGQYYRGLFRGNQLQNLLNNGLSVCFSLSSIVMSYLCFSFSLLFLGPTVICGAKWLLAKTKRIDTKILMSVW